MRNDVNGRSEPKELEGVTEALVTWWGQSDDRYARACPKSVDVDCRDLTVSCCGFSHNNELPPGRDREDRRLSDSI